MELELYAKCPLCEKEMELEEYEEDRYWVCLDCKEDFAEDEL